jgi:hypothetical protein
LLETFGPIPAPNALALDPPGVRTLKFLNQTSALIIYKEEFLTGNKTTGIEPLT